MDSVIDDFKAKNFDLEIEGSLYAVNVEFDFSGFLDVDQALGASMLVDILKDLDDQNVRQWTIHGWYPKERFGDDHNGVMDDMSFFNEAYFINEMKMDELWYGTPCLSIRKSMASDRVFIGVDDAPYGRHTIMEHVPLRKAVIRNDMSYPFPGEDAIIAVRDDRYRTENGTPYWMRFRMPEVYCIRSLEEGTWKQTWRFITSEDREEMRAKLNRLTQEYWEERE